MIDYAYYQCYKCLNKSVGFFIESDGKYSYTCNKHWWIRHNIEDRELLKQEYEMYKDKEWYIKLYPEKFVDTAPVTDKKIKLIQNTLF